MEHLADGGGDGMDPGDFFAAQCDRGIEGIETGEDDGMAVVCCAVDAEEDVSAEAVAEACDDTVAGVREAVGIEDGEFAIVVLGEHGISCEAEGESIGICHAESEVLCGSEDGLSRRGQFTCGRDGEHGEEGDARGRGCGSRRNREGWSLGRNGGGWWSADSVDGGVI